MAVPIDFQVKKRDPRHELERRLQATPIEHAEAILVTLDVLEAAHQKGLLDFAHGAISSKNAVFAKIAEYAKQPEGTRAMRNAILLGRLLGSIDPSQLDIVLAPQPLVEDKPPTFRRLLKSMRAGNFLRGLKLVVGLITALGSAQGKKHRSS